MKKLGTKPKNRKLKIAGCSGIMVLMAISEIGFTAFFRGNAQGDSAKEHCSSSLKTSTGEMKSRKITFLNSDVTFLRFFDDMEITQVKLAYKAPILKIESATY